MVLEADVISREADLRLSDLQIWRRYLNHRLDSTRLGSGESARAFLLCVRPSKCVPAAAAFGRPKPWKNDDDDQVEEGKAASAPVRQQRQQHQQRKQATNQPVLSSSFCPSLLAAAAGTKAEHAVAMRAHEMSARHSRLLLLLLLRLLLLLFQHQQQQLQLAAAAAAAARACRGLHSVPNGGPTECLRGWTNRERREAATSKKWPATEPAASLSLAPPLAAVCRADTIRHVVVVRSRIKRPATISGSNLREPPTRQQQPQWTSRGVVMVGASSR